MEQNSLLTTVDKTDLNTLLAKLDEAANGVQNSDQEFRR